MIEGTVRGPDSPLIVAACPVCGGVVELAAPAEGMTLECPDCEELLLVASLEPLTLAVATDPDEVPFPPEDEFRA